MLSDVVCVSVRETNVVVKQARTNLEGIYRA